MELFIAFLLWVAAWILNAANNVILFRYTGSVFNRLDNWHGAWWKLNARPGLKKIWFLPMIWDGWHATKWLERVCYFGMLFVFVPDLMLAIFFGLFAVFVFLIFYRRIFTEVRYVDQLR